MLACNLLRLTRLGKCLADAGVPLRYLCDLWRMEGLTASYLEHSLHLNLHHPGCLNQGYSLYIISDKCPANGYIFYRGYASVKL